MENCSEQSCKSLTVLSLNISGTVLQIIMWKNIEQKEQQYLLNTGSSQLSLGLFSLLIPLMIPCVNRKPNIYAL